MMIMQYGQFQRLSNMDRFSWALDREYICRHQEADELEESKRRKVEEEIEDGNKVDRYKDSEDCSRS